MTTAGQMQDVALISDDVWSKAAAEVPDKSNLKALRARLEAAGDRYREYAPNRARWSREQERWVPIEAQSRVLLDLLPEDDESRAEISKLLDRASEKAFRAKYMLDDLHTHIQLRRFVKPSDAPRLILYRNVVSLWIGAGGEVKRNFNSNKEGGPCVRFLSLILGALMGDEAPAKSSLGKIVKEWQAQRDFDLSGGTLVVTHLVADEKGETIKTKITEVGPDGQVRLRKKTPNGRDRRRKKS